MSTAPTGAVVENAVRLAGHAPSLHNSQPWRWTLDGAELHLFAVPERMLPATDTAGRQLVISCGIALGHLSVAMAASGWHTHVALFPNPSNHRHLATIRFTPALIATEADRDRAEAIVRRHTDRLPFASPGDWGEFETVLRSTFAPDDAILDVLPDDTRPALARASELSAALRRYDSRYQAELQWWTGHVVANTGVPRQALASREERERVTVGRKLPVSDGESRRPGLDTDRSKILVLSTDGDGDLDLLNCGEVLSTVLLECTLAGYATCPLTHMTELPRSRSIVRELIGRNALPQVLIRVGIAPASTERPEPTPRLPLKDILQVAPR